VITSPSDLGNRVDALLQPLVDRHDASGVVRIEQGGRTLFAAAYGLASREHNAPNTLRTRFLIGSISKQFTAAGILALQDRGRLGLDDTLDCFVAGFPSGDRITLRQLLTHTAGLSRDLPDPEINSTVTRSPAEIVDLLKAVPLVAEPGVRTSYSNNGYRVLARVIELAAGESYDGFIRSAVLEPAGMLDSGVFRDQDLIERLATGYCPWPGPDGLGRAPYAAASNTWGPGAIYATAPDLARWSRALSGDAVLSAGARQAMLAPTPDGRGLGVSVYARFGRRCVGHDGVYFGYTASFEWYPDDELTVVYLGNIETGSLRVIRPALPAIVFGEPYPPAPARPEPAVVAPGALDAFAGVYRVFPGLDLRVKRIGGALVLGAGDGYFLLDPVGADRFYYRLKYTSVSFERDAAGQVAALIWEEGPDTYRCARAG
jgi:CubicO group peptidase (beta-lactamase class C family)